MTPQNRVILKSLSTEIRRIGHEDANEFQRDKLSVAVMAIDLALGDKEQPCEQTKNKFHDGRPGF